MVLSFGRKSSRKLTTQQRYDIFFTMMKRCARCQKRKSIKSFHRNRYASDGLHAFCKSCRCPTIRKYMRKREPLRYMARLTQLGLKPKRRCDICGGTNRSHRRLSGDHSHRTGKGRGILCQKCNAGLGLFRDSPKLLRRAIKYLS